MNLPNRLSLFRIILTFLFMFLLFSHGLLAKTLALITFILASLTDFYDGYFARKYNLLTDLGKLLDPLADKVLVLAAFLAFVEMRFVPAWMVVIIILRELMITGMRILAVNKGKVLAASLAGKHKTVSQMISILVVLGVMVLKEVSLTFFNFWTNEFEFWTRIGIYVLMLITIALTLISGAFYLTKNKEIFWGGKAN